jgi:hypothetical protein
MTDDGLRSRVIEDQWWVVEILEDNKWNPWALAKRLDEAQQEKINNESIGVKTRLAKKILVSEVYE